MESLLAHLLDVPSFKIKSHFPHFPYQPSPMQLASHGCFGKSLKKGQSVCWANCFFPIGNISTTFFGKCGCSPSVRCYFLSQNELYFHAVFHTFDRAQMNNSWMHIKPWKYEYGKKETTSLNLFVNCPQIYAVVYRTSISGTKPPVQHIVYVISEQWPYSCAVRSKFFESDSPISSPSLAWLPWPFSRGVPLSISKLTPYAEDSLCGRETGEREWGKPLRRTFCWRLRLSSTFTIEEYALLCSLDEATGCILMGIPFSGTPLASQMLKQLKYVGAWGIFTLTLLGPHPGRKTNTMGILIISFVSPSGAQETVESSRPSQNVN